MHHDSLKIKGRVTLKHYNKHGILLHEVINQNLIVNTGFSFFIDKILDIPLDSATVGDRIEYIGIGNGLEPSYPEQTSLEKSLAQNANIGFIHTTFYKPIRFKRNFENNLIVETTLEDEEYIGDVHEIGLFTNALTDNDIPSTLIARTVLDTYSRFTKTNTDYLSVSWNILFGD